MHYLIIRGVTTLQELRNCYTLQDVYDAVDALETYDTAKGELEEKLAAENKPKASSK